jgi:hypothetical protein
LLILYQRLEQRCQLFLCVAGRDQRFSAQLQHHTYEEEHRRFEEVTAGILNAKLLEHCTNMPPNMRFT